MRSNFDKQLVVLNSQLTDMAALAENAIDCAAEALIFFDKEKAKLAIEYDGEIDEIEKEIERLCLLILLQQQPVAKDLRQVSAALKMITDMERIGDQARDISEIILTSPQKIQITQEGNIAQMARATKKMIHDVVDSFVKADIQLAQQIIDFDDVIDNFYDNARRELIEEIQSGSERVEVAVDLLSISKYFERIGDHATNIAEWVIFSLTGVHKSN
ncbi:MAG: phosphate signaling complex protein PhoU [Oscillospiraceae bacterium]